MNKEDIFKNIYKDFFGIDKISKENEKLYEEIKKLEEEAPYIDVKPVEEKEDVLPITNIEDNLKNINEKIDNLYIEEKSKNLLKKIVEYISKFYKGEEKQYIPFNISLYTDNKETVQSITNILNETVTIFNYLKHGECKEISLYNIDKIETLEEIYIEGKIVVFTDLNILSTKENDYKNKFLFKLNELIEKNLRNKITILNAKNKDIVNGFVESNLNLKNKFVDFEIIGVNPTAQEVVQDVKEKTELSEEMEVKLLDYITNTFSKYNLSYPEYRDGLIKNIIFNKEIPEYEKEKTLDEIFEELNSLIGLTKVKKMLNDLVNLIELKNKAKDDLKIKDINLHMVFLGNPGTGKTTVARMISGILYNLKYIKQNKLVEVSSKDLVAEYVGQTAPKTMAVIQKALGGVLFIDEAYSLASGSGQGNSYNEEAVATLIQEMENHRDELVVIFAGYTKEMQDFLNLNSGIVSRIGYTFEFEDYTTDELIAIFKQMIEKAGFNITSGAIDKLRNIIEKNRNNKNFGNARFVRNVYEKTIVKHASNTKGKKGKSVLKTLTEEDINAENLI